MTRSSCNYGVDATTGLPYVEFRFTGTATTGGGNSGGNIRWDTSVGINCNPGDTFSQSIYAAITAGDLTNVVNFTLGLYTTDATGTVVTAPSYVTNPLAINDVMQRFAVPPFTLAGTTNIRHV